MVDNLVRLRGVLSRAFDNGILCMRGFARIDYLATISKVDTTYQRAIRADHQDEIEEYFRRGQYRFFPELILGVALEDLGCKNPREDFDTLCASVDNGQGFPIRTFGDSGVRISSYAQGHTPSDAFAGGNVSLSVIGLPAEEERRVLYRIDGNHRLTAIEAMLKDDTAAECSHMQVPYCLVIFPTRDICSEQSSVFFHNINFTQMPVPEDCLLKLILNQPLLIRDEVLKEDPSFGVRYYWARKFSEQCVKLKTRYISIFPNLEKYWEIFLVRVYSLLVKRDTEIPDPLADVFEDGRLIRSGRKSTTILRSGMEVADAVECVKTALGDVLEAVLSPQHYSFFQTINGEVLAALVYERCRSQPDLRRFISWFESNQFFRLRGELLDRKDSFYRSISAGDLVDMYEQFSRRESNTIFLSMAFGKPETENHYLVIKRVVDEINREQNLEVPLVLQRVDCMDQGYSYEINHKISEAIAGCGLLIANLTYVNPNVYHEVGLAMGGAIAKTQDPGRNLLLILDVSVPTDNCAVGFNLCPYRQIRFNQSEILGQRIKREIEIHFGLRKGSS